MAGERIFGAGTFWGFLRHWVGCLGRSVRGLDCWGLGLGLAVIMVESRHRKWQGVNVSGSGSFDCRWGELAATNPGANRLAAMDFRFLPTVGMTGRGIGLTLRHAQRERGARNDPSTGSGRTGGSELYWARGPKRHLGRMKRPWSVVLRGWFDGLTLHWVGVCCDRLSALRRAQDVRGECRQGWGIALRHLMG